MYNSREHDLHLIVFIYPRLKELVTCFQLQGTCNNKNILSSFHFYFPSLKFGHEILKLSCKVINEKNGLNLQHSFNKIKSLIKYRIIISFKAEHDSEKALLHVAIY